ncbi:MAG: cytochrome c [candidate division NC10 bacterium]|nr:cytochrome c [candidate division NC10 bacterium]
MSRAGLIIGGVSLIILGVSFGWGATRVTDKDLEEGELLYREACASCHGEDGKGQVPGLEIKVPPPDLTWCAFNSEEPDRDWILITAEGGPATGRSDVMPSFRDALTEDQIRQVVAYLRTFCTEDWPRGELNFPRPLVTEKAWPENEIVFTWNTARTPGDEQSTQFSWTLEKRVGPRGQVEVKFPFQINDPEGQGAVGGIGDVEAGIKYVLYDNLEQLFLSSGGLEVGAPTGSIRRGLGDGTTILSPFLAAGKAWGDLIGQGSFKFEYPVVTRRAPKALLYNLAFTYPILAVGRLTEGQVLLELNGKSEWGTEAPKHFQLSLTPGLRKALTRSGLWAAAVGVQVPVTGVRDVDYRVMGYLLYEYPPFRFGR